MYRCEACGRVVEAGKPAHKIMVETRQREYPARNEGGGDPRSRGGGRGRRRGDPGGIGREVVREQQVCAACATSFESEAGLPSEPI